MKTPNVHNNWDRLKEVWLGDVWPAHFYDDLEPEIRDAWYQITEWTKEDLSKIQKKLEELGVNVLRPYVDGHKDMYRSKNPKHQGRLGKPPITPRDNNAVIGNKLFVNDDLNPCYKAIVDQYAPQYVYNIADAIRNNDRPLVLSGANLVKLGRDIIIDKWTPEFNRGERNEFKKFVFNTYQDFEQTAMPILGNDYRLHLATQGGHCDGCFMPLREGLLLATHYYKDYEMLFPGWDKIVLSSPTYSGTQWGNRNAQRWQVPGLRTGPFFNEYIEKFCPEWIGNFTETYFEVNVLVIDEKNVLCMAAHDSLFEDLERKGITCHVVPFRTRTFWDGGLHCITLDTIREGQVKDYYPNRGGHGIKSVVSYPFDHSTEKFYAEYSKWLETGEIT